MANQNVMLFCQMHHLFKKLLMAIDPLAYADN